jgi:hypothetical protein
MKPVLIAALTLCALVLVAVPSRAVIVNQHHQLRTADGDTARRCSLTIDTVTRDYQPTIRVLDVNGWFRCRAERWTSKSLMFRPHGAGPRHSTTVAVGDDGRPYHFHIEVQCNNKADGAHWNHPFQQIDLHSHAYAYNSRQYLHYATQIVSNLPFKC